MQQQQTRWQRRPVAGRLLGALVVLVPVLAGVLAGLGVARLLGPTDGAPETIGVLVAVVVATTATVVAVERLTRRLAPLAMLLRLGLVFPDAAPARFRVAMRAARPRRLAEALAAEDEDDASPEVALGLLAALLAHDRGTRGHSERTAAFTAMVAEAMGLPEDEVLRAEWGALLHDIGKLEVPTSLLRKQGGLADDEWSTMRAHPELGARLVAPLAPWLRDGTSAVVGHHERWDGGGYPEGLAGTEIPVAARIVAVTDAFETMTAARSYKDPIARQEARAELEACAGGQFDPQVVRAFLSLSIPRLWLVAGPLAALVQVPLLGPVLRGTVLAPNLSGTTSGVLGSVGQAAVGAAVAGTAVVAATVVAPGSAGPELPAAAVEVVADSPASEVGAEDRPGAATSAVIAKATAAPLAVDPQAAAARFLEAIAAEAGTAPASREPAGPPAPAPPAPGPPTTDPGAGEPASEPQPGAGPRPGGTPPGQVPGSNPGHGGTPPGHGGTPPGQIPGGNPGHGGTPPGQG